MQDHIIISCFIHNVKFKTFNAVITNEPRCDINMIKAKGVTVSRNHVLYQHILVK